MTQGPKCRPVGAGSYPGSVSVLPWAQLDALIDPTLESRAADGVSESTVTPGID